MKNFIIKRYYLHFIIGFCLSFIMAYHTDFLKYSTIDMVVADISLAIVITVIAGFYEWAQTSYVQSKQPDSDTWDWFDVIFSGVGALVGCGVYYATQNQTFYQVQIGIIVAVMVYECIRIIRNK